MLTAKTRNKTLMIIAFIWIYFPLTSFSRGHANELKKELHVFFLIRNLFIRKLGWRISKNKKKTKKFSRLTQTNLKKEESSFSLTNQWFQFCGGFYSKTRQERGHFVPKRRITQYIQQHLKLEGSECIH